MHLDVLQPKSQKSWDFVLNANKDFNDLQILWTDILVTKEKQKTDQMLKMNLS